MGGKNFSGVAKTYYLPKKYLKHTIFFQKKVEKISIWLAKGGGASAPSCPPLRTADAHDVEV